MYFPGVLGIVGNRRGLPVLEKCKTLTDLSLVSPSTAFARQLFKSNQRQIHSLTGNSSQYILSESEHAGAALTAAHPSSLALASLPHTLVFPSASRITTCEFSVNSYLDFFTLFLHLLCIFNNENVAFVHFVVSSVPQPVLVSLGTQIHATQTHNEASKLAKEDE